MKPVTNTKKIIYLPPANQVVYYVSVSCSRQYTLSEGLNSVRWTALGLHILYVEFYKSFWWGHLFFPIQVMTKTPSGLVPRTPSGQCPFTSSPERRSRDRTQLQCRVHPDFRRLSSAATRLPTKTRDSRNNRRLTCR